MDDGQRNPPSTGAPADIGASDELDGARDPSRARAELRPAENTTIARDVFDADRVDLRLPRAGVDIRELLTRIERDLLAQALARAHGNKSEAARLLGLQRTTLIEKLRRLRTSD